MFNQDAWAMEFLAMMQKVCDSAEPDFFGWWSQQPLDMVQCAIEDFENTLKAKNNNLCRAMLSYLKGELEMCARFHRTIKNAVIAADLIPGRQPIEIDWRLRPPRENLIGPAMEPIGPIVERGMAQIIKNIENNV